MANLEEPNPGSTPIDFFAFGLIFSGLYYIFVAF
jgi:hypothetical protein